MYAGAGNPRPPEWADLARRLCEGRGIEVAPPAPLAVGDGEFRRIMDKTRTPVLAVEGFPALPATVVRPLVDPVPLSPLSPVWRKGPGAPRVRRPAEGGGPARDRERLAPSPAGGWFPVADETVMSVLTRL